MAPRRLNLGKISIRKICACLVAIYLTRWFMLTREKITTATHSMVIKGRTAKYAWDVVADLGHFQISDPQTRITQITSDKFDHPEWRYSVILEQVDRTGKPLLTHANYVVKPDGKYFSINADYSTCVYFIFCVYESSLMSFRDLKSTASVEGNLYHSASMTANVTIRMSWLAGFIFKSNELLAKHWLRLDRLQRQMSLE